MDGIFIKLKDYLLGSKRVFIDSVSYRLHYRITTVMLIAFSVVISLSQYVGEPIQCISKDDIPEPVLNKFCWIHATFSIEHAWNKSVGVEVPYPGVDKHTKGEEKVYHAYYQWVWAILLLQAFSFSLPRYLWKRYENKTVANLLEKTARSIAKRLFNSRGTHNRYGLIYYLTVVLNFANVVGQIYVIDAFLGGEFTTYGLKVIQFTEWSWSLRDDPMIRVFPRMAKCTFHRFGSSGDVQKHDAMCILPINIFNEKIYVFLWFWFVILAVITAIELIYRAIIFYSPTIRYALLESRGMFEDRYDELEKVIAKLNPCDWIFLSFLVKNMDYSKTQLIVFELARKFDEISEPKDSLTEVQN